MQTLTLVTSRYGNVTINYNSDWSGLAIISFLDFNTDTIKEVRIPGELLTALGRTAAVDFVQKELTAKLEQLAWNDMPGTADLMPLESLRDDS